MSFPGVIDLPPDKSMILFLPKTKARPICVEVGIPVVRVRVRNVEIVLKVSRGIATAASSLVGHRKRGFL